MKTTMKIAIILAIFFSSGVSFAGEVLWSCEGVNQSAAIRVTDSYWGLMAKGWVDGTSFVYKVGVDLLVDDVQVRETYFSHRSVRDGGINLRIIVDHSYNEETIGYGHLTMRVDGKMHNILVDCSR